MSAVRPGNLIVIRRNDVCKKLKISNSTLYNKLNRASSQYDPSFPKQVRLGASSVGWIESEIDDWVLSHRIESPSQVPEPTFEAKTVPVIQACQAIS